MDIRHLFSSQGAFVAYAHRGFVFGAAGKYAGYVRGDDVYRNDGAYLATIVDHRLLRLRAGKPPDARPVLPPSGIAPPPIHPFVRNPSPLPEGYEDVTLSPEGVARV
ncbi:MAG: hypothetical protein PVSMB8_14190 [Vulcanimicrobiaceae bacterium]